MMATDRSPWNEAEAGYHYVRSMASWALMLAYSGFQYDARDDSIVFAPAAASDQFSCFFSAASSWGVFTQNSEHAEIELKDGSLKLSRVQLQIPASGPPAMVSVNSTRVAASIECNEADSDHLLGRPHAHPGRQVTARVSRITGLIR